MERAKLHVDIILLHHMLVTLFIYDAAHNVIVTVRIEINDFLFFEVITDFTNCSKKITAKNRRHHFLSHTAEHVLTII